MNRTFSTTSLSNKVNNPMDPHNQKIKQHLALVHGMCFETDCEKKSCGTACAELFYILGHFTHNKYLPAQEAEEKYVQFLSTKDFNNELKTQYLMVYKKLQKLQEYDPDLMAAIATGRFKKRHLRVIKDILDREGSMNTVHADIKSNMPNPPLP